MKIGDLETHPVADVYPLMKGEAFDMLVEDLRERGLREPIWLVRIEEARLILDGRNRLRACLEAAVSPRFQEYDGPADLESLLVFSLSLNCARRHLSHAQLSMIATRSIEMYEQAARDRMLATQNNDRGRAARANWPPQVEGKSRDLVARHFGISTRAVRDASVVLKRGVPALIEAVDNDELAINAAAELALRGAEQQIELLALVRDSPRKLRAILRERQIGDHRAPGPDSSPAHRTEKPVAVVRDERGRKVPGPLAAAFTELRRAYDEASHQIDEGARQIQAGRKQVIEAERRVMEQAPPELRKKLEHHFEGQDVWLRRIASSTALIVRHFKPCVTCPSCDGDGCEDCSHIGWQTAFLASDEQLIPDDASESMRPH